MLFCLLRVFSTIRICSPVSAKIDTVKTFGDSYEFLVHNGRLILFTRSAVTGSQYCRISSAVTIWEISHSIWNWSRLFLVFQKWVVSDFFSFLIINTDRNNYQHNKMKNKIRWSVNSFSFMSSSTLSGSSSSMYIASFLDMNWHLFLETHS